MEHVDDGRNSKHLNISALAAGGATKTSTADKQSKIKLLEEQLKKYQTSNNDFEVDLNKSSTPTEPLIKKYQYNKDAAATNSGRYQNYQRRKRKPY